MGKLADAIKQYKTSPSNSPAEREAKDIITQITESQWWKDNVGTEFKWPVKKEWKSNLFGFGEEFVRVGQFIIHRDNLDETIALLTKKEG